MAQLIIVIARRRSERSRSNLTRSVIPECFNRGSTILDSRFRGNDSDEIASLAFGLLAMTVKDKQ